MSVTAIAERPIREQVEAQHAIAMTTKEKTSWNRDQYAALVAALFAGTAGAPPSEGPDLPPPSNHYASLIEAMTIFDKTRQKPGAFATDVLPLLTAAAVSFEAVVPPKLPLLLKERCPTRPHSVASSTSSSSSTMRAASTKHLSLSRRQCYCILACAFLCAFPRPYHHRRGDPLELPGINYHKMFHSPRQYSETQKLVMHFDYFADMGSRLFGTAREKDNNVQLEDPVLGLTIVRVALGRDALNELLAAPGRPLLAPTVHPLRASIDDQLDMARVDFANKYIGGGSLGGGCVQEEITFSIAPELNVSRYLCDRMDDNEAIILLNSLYFSSIVPGTYANSTKHLAAVDCTKTPVPNAIIAIDALHFRRNDWSQYTADAMKRELVKAVAGFHPLDPKVVPPGPAAAATDNLHRCVATGNWGCGAFNGDVELKTLIQWVAASLVGREMHYFPFDNQRVSKEFPKLAKALLSKSISASDLWAGILQAATSSQDPLFDSVALHFGIRLSAL